MVILNLRKRTKDEVVPPRPISGDHKKLVQAALEDTLLTQKETLKTLSEV